MEEGLSVDFQRALAVKCSEYTRLATDWRAAIEVFSIDPTLRAIAERFDTSRMVRIEVEIKNIDCLS